MRQQCCGVPDAPESRLAANTQLPPLDGTDVWSEHPLGATAGRCSWFQQLNVITATKPAQHICLQNIRSHSWAMVGQVFSTRAPWRHPGSAVQSALAILKPFHGQISRPDLLCNKRILNTSQILQHQIKANFFERALGGRGPKHRENTQEHLILYHVRVVSRY